MSENRADALIAFAGRHEALLRAMAMAWQTTGAGCLVWRAAGGSPVYQSGAAANPGLSAPVLDGTLFVEGAGRELEPMLVTQARLLDMAVRSESGADLLVAELMRTTDQLVALYEISAAARLGRDVDDVMRTTVGQAVQLTRAAGGLLIIRAAWREGAIRVFAVPESAAVDPQRAAEMLAAAEDRAEPLIANSAEECAALLGLPTTGARRLICSPIAIAGRIDAVLCVIDRHDDFTAGDLKLVTALADAAAGFLERERSHALELTQMRLSRDLEIAAEIQSRLMPRQVPTVPGVQVAATWRPTLEMGGDFFDVQVLPGHRLALIVGDVTGKGVPAALLMAVAHGLLRSGLATARSLMEAVGYLNAGLAADLMSTNRLLTLFAAVFDPASGELRAVNCGHSPILVYQDGRVSLWEADGPPIGFLPDLMSQERRRSFRAGDALIALSDGFSEARDVQGRRLGIDALIAVVQHAARRSAADIADALQQHVDAFAAGGPRGDDQTLIVMKVAQEK